MLLQGKHHSFQLANTNSSVVQVVVLHAQQSERPAIIYCMTCNITPQVQEYDTKQVITKLITIWYPLCRDYGDFLAIKSDNNIPIIRYPSLTMHF